MKSSSSMTMDEHQVGGPPQRRTGNFILSLTIMMFSFFLYDLGLFGGVEGPLTPDRIGSTLAALGINRTHMVGLSAALAVVALSWHWILNTVNRRMGARLTCAIPGKNGDACAAPAKREQTVSRKTGETRTHYICAAGHKCDRADFHKAARGPVGNSVGIFCLIVCFVFLFLS